jgi:hypothetical protein
MHLINYKHFFIPVSALPNVNAIPYFCNYHNKQSINQLSEISLLHYYDN